jgi:hypothetical protein
VGGGDFANPITAIFNHSNYGQNTKFPETVTQAAAENPGTEKSRQAREEARPLSFGSLFWLGLRHRAQQSASSMPGRADLGAVGIHQPCG